MYLIIVVLPLKQRDFRPCLTAWRPKTSLGLSFSRRTLSSNFITNFVSFSKVILPGSSREWRTPCCASQLSLESHPSPESLKGVEMSFWDCEDGTRSSADWIPPRSERWTSLVIKQEESHQQNKWKNSQNAESNPHPPLTRQGYKTPPKSPQPKDTLHRRPCSPLGSCWALWKSFPIWLIPPSLLCTPAISSLSRIFPIPFRKLLSNLASFAPWTFQATCPSSVRLTE